MDRETLLDSHGQTGNADTFFELGQSLEGEGNLELAASAYDRAFGLRPDDETIVTARYTVLEQLAIEEYGIKFRYIPAGTFLMGSDDGDPDEQPVHAVRLDAYWMAETPMSWAKFCEIMDFQAPPLGLPNETWRSRQSQAWMDELIEMLPEHMLQFYASDKHVLLERSISPDRKICLQYCENETTGARDWHAHIPDMEWQRGDGTKTTSAEMFGVPPREKPEADYAYSQKPVVSVNYLMTYAIGLRMSNAETRYRLPTEAEWEKAARGGLINAKYAWGDAAPTQDTCDFDRFADFSIRPFRQFAPNAYGLFAMCGGVWEWVSDRYDSRYYENSPKLNPTGSSEGEQNVLRGGSWADDAHAVTVSYRSSAQYGGSPNIGFRLCRKSA